MNNHKRIQHEKNYIQFLENSLRSKNFKANVSPKEYEETERKLKKAKLVLKILEI